MPNWVEGVMKLRGKRENIEKFLTEGLVPIPLMDKGMAQLLGKPYVESVATIESDEDEFSMSNKYGFAIPGARRAMIESDIEWYLKGEDVEVLHIDGFKQAWAITEAEPYLNLAKQYDIDMRIYVFERGMQFNQELVIEDGEVKKFVDITFDDYEWECVFPHMGG